MESSRELQDRKFSFRHEISFFQKGPTFHTFTRLPVQLPEQILIWGASGKPGGASLLPASLGFLANKGNGMKSFYQASQGCSSLCEGSGQNGVDANELVPDKSSEAHSLL